ncbi:hypothetical protein [Mesorhizobium sp.]|uniref:hypothetical protein n=1 Tax=Mesorhizobium sp. TaxID=1871066 RepID=UPI000FE98A99|nr:hypothetical protein [Mesorhizobium sp.]RWC32698.1 MAG: hypothetical protein EOS27_06295 [Mesorhizobium sp.]TIX28060.1 MAG: hypothetical protein E5V35_03790 [Mesorhizobium sp.]
MKILFLGSPIAPHPNPKITFEKIMNIPHVSIDEVGQLGGVHQLVQAGDYDEPRHKYTVLYDRFAQFLSENGVGHRLE